MKYYFRNFSKVSLPGRSDNFYNSKARFEIRAALIFQTTRIIVNVADR